MYNSRRARDALPRTEHDIQTLPKSILEQDLKKSLQHEEYFLNLMRVRCIALTRENVHYAERKSTWWNDIRVCVFA
jgi:hypothetical protein